LQGPTNVGEDLFAGSDQCGVGPKAIRILEQELADRGLGFAP
jgi:hypothetical protein